MHVLWYVYAIQQRLQLVTAQLHMQKRLATALDVQVPLPFSAHTGALAFILHPCSPQSSKLQVLMRSPYSADLTTPPALNSSAAPRARSAAGCKISHAMVRS